jgi:transcriptional regulator with XRE-family HTH domain
MNPDDAEEYTQALGQVVAGGYRQVALGERLGVPQALGLSTREWVEQRLGGYVRMSIPERREAVAELADEGMTQRQIGDVLGVDHATVNRDLRPGADAPPEPSPAIQSVPASGADAPPEVEPPAALNPAVSEFLDADPDLQRARYLHEFMKALTRSDDFMEFDPEKLAEMADPTVTRTVDDYLIRVRNFSDRFHHARPALRAVNGEKS